MRELERQSEFRAEKPRLDTEPTSVKQPKIDVIRRDENEGTTESVGLLPEWFDAYKLGNISYPQDPLGMDTFGGNAIVRSLHEGVVDLKDVIESDLSPDQIDELRTIVEAAHTRYNVPFKPEGRAQEGEQEIPDTRYSELWSAAKRHTLRTIVTSCMPKDPQDFTESEIRRSKIKRVAADLCQDDAGGVDDSESVETVQNLPAYEQVLPILAAYFDAAAHASRSDEAKIIAAHRRDSLDPQNETPLSTRRLESQLLNLMMPEIDAEAMAFGLPVETSLHFLSNVASNHPTFIERRLRYRRPIEE